MHTGFSMPSAVPELPFRVPQPLMVLSAEQAAREKAVSDAERFTEQVLGEFVDLYKEFDIPLVLPYANPLLIFDPGCSTQDLLMKVLTSRGLLVVKKSGAPGGWVEHLGKEERKLICIDNSLTPTRETMGHPKVYLRAGANEFMDLRAYVLAFALKLSVSKQHLDEETYTVFPSDVLSEGRRVHGTWYVPSQKVGIAWAYPEQFRLEKYGARRVHVIPKRKG